MRMYILAHRGYWLYKEEENTLPAFYRAFENGFGVETDIRDFHGQIVISHNIPMEGCIQFKEFADQYVKAGKKLPLALNVKSDGIQKILKELLLLYGIDHYFMFDMSIPEQVVYLREGFHTFARQSEYEREIVMYGQVEGIWMDEFETAWITKEVIEKHLKNGKRVGIISSEIHHQNADRLWNIIIPFRDNKNLLLCTDEPMKARNFFR